MTLFSETCNLCADILRSLGKVVLQLVGTYFASIVLAMLLDIAHIRLSVWLAWVPFFVVSGVVFYVVSKMEVFETKAEFSSYSKPAWVFAICVFSIVVPLGVYVNVFDHYIGSAVFSLSYWLGSALGIGHKVAFLLLAIYVPACGARRNLPQGPVGFGRRAVKKHA